jgi:hypothetical protein
MRGLLYVSCNTSAVLKHVTQVELGLWVVQMRSTAE